MHIAYVTTEYPPQAGGIGTSIQNLAREIVRQGHKVTVLGLGNQRAEWEDQGVTVRFMSRTHIPKIGWLENRRMLNHEINRLTREENLEVVEAPDWDGLSAGMKLNCPLVIRCHGSDTYFGSLLGYHPRWSVRMAESMALHHADQITAVSQFTADKTRALFNLPQAIEVISNGVDLEKFQIQKGSDDGFILYFGTLVRKKGILELANIFSKVVERFPSARLVLAGRDAIDKITGLSTWDLFKRATSPDALVNTEYIGAKNYDEMQSLIQKAAACVFPSYAEALPVSWIEAMACGKTVVASNIGWAKEIIEDGVSGFLIHPADHTQYAEIIANLLQEPEKREKIGCAARAKIEGQFDIRAIARKNIEWYQRVITHTDHKIYSSRSNWK